MLDGLIARAQELGAKGLVWAFREGEGWRSPTAKFLSAEELAALNERLEAGEGDLLLVVADEPDVANAVLAPAAPRPRRAVRADRPGGGGVLLGRPSGRCSASTRARGAGTRCITRSPRPAGEFDPASPGEAMALAYDVVWNGQELGGGSIRISDPELQQRALEAIGIDRAEAEERFGFLLEALRYGAPPHGGIAYGLDRIVQRLEHADSIRDVIAFPKAASGADPLTGAPAPVDEAQLRELGIALRRAKPSARRVRATRWTESGRLALKPQALSGRLTECVQSSLDNLAEGLELVRQPLKL